jgi:hypothetical protein
MTLDVYALLFDQTRQAKRGSRAQKAAANIFPTLPKSGLRFRGSSSVITQIAPPTTSTRIGHVTWSRRTNQIRSRFAAPITVRA